MADPSDSSEAIVYVLTPPGRGAVAVIAIAGRGTIELIEKSFCPASGARLAELTEERIVYGRWGREPAEEVIVWRRGEYELEVHCHGGRAAVERIIEDLISAGARRRDWQSWIESHEANPIRRAARTALAGALSRRTAAILLDQYHGALESEIEAIHAMLREPQANLDAAANRLETLLGRASIGLHLVRPWRITIAGPPNVGKSSLLNALAGFERAIVFDQPGTTRDVLKVLTAIDGWPIELADTAGWRDSSDPIEAAGVERARRRATESDLVVLVFDASVELNVGEKALIAHWPDALIVQNKSDLIAPNAKPVSPHALLTSAKTGAGLQELMQAIARRVVPLEPTPGEGVPFTADQVTCLESASKALASGQTHSAAQHLLALLSDSSNWKGKTPHLMPTNGLDPRAQDR